ncbi:MULTISPECIES: YeaH/YhbH family protein [unclassified Rubrivivax]|uniref:YeaH/YhbH family protein n=1 Tax=unclassified Rubrivivax TaxID=2649762 RepID=UPI001E41A05B|nr:MULTISPECIES: YeaH/YhbH family protein [unclassified Rubrivivax]MCC9596790.1 YeaH/YhbH family protein [Rubrivivax sp. JA1055]MCC9648948.1 YeaH/YhbH family protein [Rubrivivax sp. JA1029]
MQQIIDRRLAGKNKSIGNRERFLRRHKEQIREAVKRAIDGRGIRDIERGEEIHIPKRDLSEPVFGHGQGGVREIVHPGNQEYIRGDRIERPKGGGGGGSGSGQASDQGEGEDDFAFALSKEEFMQVFFEDLALPHLVRTQLAEVPEWKTHRAGFSSDGTPNNLHVVRSMRGAIGRRIAIGAGSRRELRELEDRLALLKAELQPGDAVAEREIEALEDEIARLRTRVERIPYLDPIDLRFRNRVRVPVPTSKAVMFCLMDVSGSMDEARKELSKRFFILLYLFLTKHYERIELVFIRHHTQAQEVDEHDFFHARETGGTVVSSALVLMEEIIRARYSPSEWNIYGAQASDGDNWHHDSGRCRELLGDKLLPLVRYYAYVQVAEEEQNLWEEYTQLQAGHRHFAMRKATSADQIYPVFRDLFKKEGKQAA